MTPAYRDRERDILDARWLGDISNDEALKLLTELYDDYKEAHSTLRTVPQGDCHGTR
jgi:hypothetical protein